MTLKPLSDHIVIQTMEAEQTTESGIVLATATKEKSSSPPLWRQAPARRRTP